MENEHLSDILPSTTAAQPDLSVLVINLLKGVIYREEDERVWNDLLDLQNRVRDYMAVLNLELILDEAEGYAFLKSRSESIETEANPRLPRLIARRPLSFPVSLMLALLRQKLAEFDASGADTRLVMTRDSLVELMRVFLPESSNEARLIDQIDSHINKIIDLGFLRRLKPTASSSAEAHSFEVRRILKAFIDAQWLAEFDTWLAAYHHQIAENHHE